MKQDCEVSWLSHTMQRTKNRRIGNNNSYNKHNEYVTITQSRTIGRKSHHDNDELFRRCRTSHFQWRRIFTLWQQMRHGVVDAIFRLTSARGRGLIKFGRHDDCLCWYSKRRRVKRINQSINQSIQEASVGGNTRADYLVQGEKKRRQRVTQGKCPCSKRKQRKKRRADERDSNRNKSVPQRRKVSTLLLTPGEARRGHNLVKKKEKSETPHPLLWYDFSTNNGVTPKPRSLLLVI